MQKPNNKLIYNTFLRLQWLTSSAIIILLVGCSQQLAVSVNNQAVFDPQGRLPNSETVNADLQGCINLALRQQSVKQPSELSVLSCSNSQITALGNIGQLTELRFIDLGNNKITNITPLEKLTKLGGLNLANNQIKDISTLINLRSLVSVSLEGNNEIPCSQLRVLDDRLKENLTRPSACEN
jgi:Leucine-rich repeat (LRR) protein